MPVKKSLKSKTTGRVAKKAVKKKRTVKKPRLACVVCGMEVTIDRVCGCEETHPIMCCGHAMTVK